MVDAFTKFTKFVLQNLQQAFTHEISFHRQVRKVEQAVRVEVPRLDEVHSRVLQLFEFGNASKQLDGSENSVASANSVKTALANLRQTVHENVDTLCPDKVQPPTLGTSFHHHPRGRKTHLKTDDDRDLSSVMGELKRLAAAFAQLLASISMLSQFQDMEIQTVFESAAGDLEVSANCWRMCRDLTEDWISTGQSASTCTTIDSRKCQSGVM